MVTINLDTLCGGEPQLTDEDRYVKPAKALAGEGQNVVLTGPAPVWLYLVVAQELQGVVRSLWCDSPVTGPVLIFHD